MTDSSPSCPAGTGCITQVNDNIFEGRYSPMWIGGKKHSRNVCAHTREECEEKPKALIVEMKAKIQTIKQSGDLTATPDGNSPKKLVAEYMRKHLDVINKSLIAREVRVNRSTVARHYDEIRHEMD